MADSKTIERFLSKNSSMPSVPVMARLVGVDAKKQYRPDKLFIRDDFMKWDMIYNDIDTPHKLTVGTVVSIVDRTWIRTELNELGDFKI